MYYEHFGFQLPPFSISPDPRFLFLSERHRDALAHLIYGAGENGGFVLLTGQVGTGKTTLIRSLLSQELPDVDIALCLHSGLSVMDFVASILDELRVDYPKDAISLKPLVDALNAHLLKKHSEGRQTVLIIDEGQNLSREVLEQVRLLTNLETDSQKLLRIILVGQEELQDIINRDDLRQLSQRITGRYHLTALNKNEVKDYIIHRIKTAKGNPSIFTTAAVKHVYRYSNGVPRLINVLCDRALLVAYNADKYRVLSNHIKIAAAETMPASRSKKPLALSNPVFSWSLLPLGIFALAAFSYSAYHYLNTLPHESRSLQKRVLSTPQITNSVLSKPDNVSRETSSFIAESMDNTSTIATIQPESEQTLEAEVSTSSALTENNANDGAQQKIESLSEKAQVPRANIDKNNNIFGENDETIEADDIVDKMMSEIAPLQSVENKDSTKEALETTQIKTTKKINILKEANIPFIDYGMSETEGVKTLLKRWSLTTAMPADKTACAYADSQAMTCLSTKGGLPLIREINRPALLELRDGKKVSWLPIIGFDSHDAAICLKDRIPQTCNTGDIASYWTGNFLVLLRKPEVSVSISPGFEGEQIQWLRQRIALAENRDLGTVSASLKFDDALVDKVKAFQKSREIDVDGVIGETTLLYLYNVVVDETTPILRSEE